MASVGNNFNYFPQNQLTKFSACSINNKGKGGGTTLKVESKANKKFELRLTRRAKAYSSSCLQTVSLSPAVFMKDWLTTVK